MSPVKTREKPQDKRPHLVDCPTCAAATGEPCTQRGSKTEVEVPHNRRYLAAGIDPYAEQPT